MKNFFVFAIILSVSTMVNGQSNRDTLHTKVGNSVMLESKHLNDNVKLFIHFPFCYKPGNEYPLIVLLDANTSFKTFSAATELMTYDKSIPCCIIVGFPQYKYAEFSSDNLEEKMEKLSDFFEYDLLPYFKSKDNITKTIIWGQGRKAGLITSYIMLEYPDLFNGYISDVPDFSLVESKVYSENAFDKIDSTDLEYYLFGNSSYDIYNKKFLNNIKSHAPEGLHCNYQVIKEPNAIIYFLTNYLHAIEMFFKDEVKE